MTARARGRPSVGLNSRPSCGACGVSIAAGSLPVIRAPDNFRFNAPPLVEPPVQRLSRRLVRSLGRRAVVRARVSGARRRGGSASNGRRARPRRAPQSGERFSDAGPPHTSLQLHQLLCRLRERGSCTGSGRSYRRHRVRRERTARHAGDAPAARAAVHTSSCHGPAARVARRASRRSAAHWRGWSA